MTLCEWMEQNDVTVGGGEVVTVYSTDPQLWQLDDFVVSSVSSGIVRLVKRPTPDDATDVQNIVQPVADRATEAADDVQPVADDGLEVGREYLVYAKPPGAKRANPLGDGGGTVINLIYATHYYLESAEKVQKFRAWLSRLRADNPGHTFEPRATKRGQELFGPRSTN